MTSKTSASDHELSRRSSIEDDVRRALSFADQRPEVNGFITRDDGGALACAVELDDTPQLAQGSPLRGWTCVVKDNIHVAYLPNSAGTPSLASFVPEADDAVVGVLREAGAVILGKANMHELAFGATSNNRRFGPVRNPVDTTRNTGGSSGGTAALVASGVARLGLGTDTGGSVRVPASFTGVCGHRPTTGAFVSTAVTPLSRSRDTIGTMARTVTDLAAAFATITGSTEVIQTSLAGLRLGLPTSYFLEGLAGDVQTAWDASLRTLAAAGVQFVAVDLSDVVDLDAEYAMPLVFAETLQELPAYLAEHRTGVDFAGLLASIGSPDVAEGFRALGYKNDDERDQVREAAFAGRQRAQKSYSAAMTAAGVDAIVFPTTPISAPLLDVEDTTVVVGGVELPTFATSIRNTSPGSFAGLPGVTVPMPVATGLPVGFGIDGKIGDDARVLAVAAVIEAAFQESF